MHNNPHTFLLISAAFMALTSCYNKANVNNAANDRLPNIILIVSDDQGYNDLGVCNEEIKTPHLDQLALEGARFTNFYSACSACTPSRSSLLTGRYPQRNGTYELFRNDRVDDGYTYSEYEYRVSPERILGMDEREIILPRYLKTKGYVSAIFGKWDLGQLKRFLPLQKGFDEFYGFVNTGIDYFKHERYSVPSMFRNNEPTVEGKGTYSTFLFEREAIRFVKENHGKPFFLYLAFNAPHSASSLDPEIRNTVQTPPEYLAMYPEGSNVREQKRRGYMAAVTCMDNAIGNVMKLVDSLGLRESTLVMFMSDNGGGVGSINSPLSGGKATMWEGGLRVPFIVNWPAKIKGGQVLDNFASSLEILPTILEATGVEPPDSIILDGFSLLPLLTGREELEREEMFWEFRDEYAARIGNMKWISSQRRKNMNGLFDLSKDLGEKNDLSAIDAEGLERTRAKFRQWQEEMAAAEDRGPFKDF